MSIMSHKNSSKGKWYKYRWSNPKSSRYIWMRETNPAIKPEFSNCHGGPEEVQERESATRTSPAATLLEKTTCNSPPSSLKQNQPSDQHFPSGTDQSNNLKDDIGGDENFDITSESNDFANGPSTNTHFSLNEFVQKLVDGNIIDSSTQPKAIALFENLRPNFGDSKSLRIHQPSVITALYGGTQCTSCGMRFEQNCEYELHLNWHLRQYKIKKRYFRWFPSVFYYNQFENQKVKETNNTGQQNQDEKVEILSCKTAEGLNAYYEVCPEELNKQHSSKEELPWQLYSAVNIDSKAYHLLYYENIQAKDVDESLKETEASIIKRVDGGGDLTATIEEEPMDDAFMEVPGSLINRENYSLECVHDNYNGTQKGIYPEVVHTIDGNIEFGSAAPICKGKMKINLTKPVPVLSPHATADEEIKTDFLGLNTNEFLPHSVKPALKGLELKKTAVVVQGHELVGVCSVM